MKNYVIPVPNMVITKDTAFMPGVYNFFDNKGITIAGSNITVDFNGAVLIGGKMKGQNIDESKKDEFSYGYKNSMKNDSLGYKGIAVYSKGTKNVTIKNLTAKNFEIGLKLDNCCKWKILSNNFSYNYNNPDHGWEEHEDLGGIVLYHTNECRIEKNRANNVWSALTIRYGNKNIVQNNDFSHTSNVGLRLWAASKNEFYNNDFSWGLRKEPYEVHARDSACVLIETGSNDNKFIKNDMRYGGDGLFIRSLNGWMSRGNYFEENDTSFANNNAIEAWDEGNTYVRNKANFSSYGFWLGNSDNTVLIENEAAFNGISFKNAPENFGNAGISVVNGSGTNFKLIGNKIHDNNGPGIAIRNRLDYPSINWIIEENEIYNNKSDERGYIGHGIYLKYAKGINLINNKFYGNDGKNIYADEYVGDIRKLKGVVENRDENNFKVKIKADSKCFVVGKPYKFKAVALDLYKKSKGNHREIPKDLEYHWDFGDGEVYSLKTVEKSFDKPGFYRVILNASDGFRINFDHINIYVLDNGIEIGKEGSKWSLKGDEGTKLRLDTIDYVSGNSSMFLESNTGRNITLRYPDREDLKLDVSEYNSFSFCIRYLNEIIDWYKDNKSPTIRFYKDKDNYVEYIPRENLFIDLANKYNESKYAWGYIELNLYNDVYFDKNVKGDFDYKELNYMELNIDNIRDSHVVFAFDGMRFINRKKDYFANILDISRYLNYMGIGEIVKTSSKSRKCDLLAPLKKSIYFGDSTKRWVSSNREGIEYYQINLGSIREFDRIVADFYHSTFSTDNNERLPEELFLEYYFNGKWFGVFDKVIKIKGSHNVFKFNPILGSKIRLTMTGKEKPLSIYNIEVNNTNNKLTVDNVNKIKTKNKEYIELNKIGIKLNRVLNEKGTKLSNLIISIYEYKDDILNSSKIFEREYNIDEINFGKETILEADLKGLDPDKSYYIALTQKNLSKDINNGQYYRWAGSGIGDMDGTYGYINCNEIINNKVGWGRNYLKLYTDKYILDLSPLNDNLGNRFGLEKMEKIYQSFNLLNPAMGIIEGLIGNLKGLSIKDNVVSIVLKEPVNTNSVVLYFNDNFNGIVDVKIDDKVYRGEFVDSICIVKVNDIIDKFEVTVNGKAILKAIELK